jgi:hypothetical protein
MLNIVEPYVERLLAERALRYRPDLREPDRLKADAAMRAAWESFFPAPLEPDPARIDQPQSAVGHRGGQSGLSLVHGGTTPVLGASRWGSSLNWSGATLAARDGGAFRAAMARFTLPQMLPPSSVPVRNLPAPANAYVGSIWVGLDGVRRSTPSLPQAGVALGWVHPAGGEQRAESYAWAQWWTTDNLDGEMRAVNLFAVEPGDTIRAWVSMEVDGTAYFRVHNENARPGMKRDAIASWLPEGRVDRGAAAGARISKRPDVRGSAACFVVERPMALVSEQVFASEYRFDQRALMFPLPNFGLVQFDHCAALMEPAGGGDCVARDLRGCRFLRMVRQEPEAGRTLRLARPRPGYHSGAPADHAFFVTYEAPAPAIAGGDAGTGPGSF